jgi:hypothetical protein
MNALTTDLIPSVTEIVDDVDDLSDEDSSFDVDDSSDGYSLSDGDVSSNVLTSPKRLFNVFTMSTVMYEDVADDVKEKGYVAISHVWGNQRIYLADDLGVNNGINWGIPLSDPNKLRRLVDAMDYLKKIYCWFDILCMPQDKQDEINKEIPFMGDYYTGADMTLVLSDMECVISEDYITWYNMVEKAIKYHRPISTMEQKWMNQHNRRALLDIYEDEWFKRVWTFQEAILSKCLILVDSNGEYLHLTDLFTKISYMVGKDSSRILEIFGKSGICLMEIVGNIKLRKTNEMSLACALKASLERKCLKERDKFYGLLGVLGYKNFPIDNTMDIREINKKMAKYSYFNRDLSWMAVGGNNADGFVQPMHENIFIVGSSWNCKPEKYGIYLEEDILVIDVVSLGVVVESEKFIESDLHHTVFHWWVVFMLEQWGFTMNIIIEVIMGFEDVSDEYMKMAHVYFKHIIMNPDPEFTRKILDDKFGKDYVETHLPEMLFKGMSTRRSAEITTVVSCYSGSGKCTPILVLGDANIGDGVLISRLSNKNISLGIITNSGKRTGVFVHKKVDFPEDEYIPFQFSL